MRRLLVSRLERQSVSMCRHHCLFARMGDRIATFLPQRRMSAFGTKRTWRTHSAMSVFGGKADIS
jgi:hypothetical protein